MKLIMLKNNLRLVIRRTTETHLSNNHFERLNTMKDIKIPPSYY
jgi:hypothetical protein